MNYNYNLILTRFYKDSNWKPACNVIICKSIENIITGESAILKQLNLQRIIKRGAKFRLSNHLKTSNFLSGFNDDLDLFIGKWCKKRRKLIKIVFRTGKNLIITRIRNKIYTNANNLNSEAIFYNAKIKRSIANIQNEFAIVPVDKANINFAIICKRLCYDVS